MVSTELQTPCQPVVTAEQPRPRARRLLQTDRITQGLVRRIGAHRFQMWFGQASLRLAGQHLQVLAESAFAAKWIEAHLMGELRKAVEETIGRSVVIEIDVRPPRHRGKAEPDLLSEGGPSPLPHEPASKTKQPSQSPRERSCVIGVRRGVRDESRHSPSPETLRCLDDFVVGPSNRLAYSTAVRFAENAEPRCISPLFIHGDCGVGKTHLLQGICRRFTERSRRTPNIRYVTGEQFTNEYITAVREDHLDAFRRRIRKLDLLAIDDVHFLANKVRTQTEFLYTLDAIDLSGARVILASDNHPHHIRKFSQALVSRFLSGMVVKVDPPDRETRLELIHRLASSRGLKLSEAAADTIASNCLGSVRELEGAVTKLTAYQFLLNGDSHGPSGSPGPIGRALAEQLFRDQATKPVPVVRLNTIIDSVCLRLSVAKTDLLGSGRHRRIVLARSLVSYLAREMTTHSFPEIAHSMGRINHSTIHTADQRLRRQIADDQQATLGDWSSVSLRTLVDELRRDLLRAHRAGN